MSDTRFYPGCADSMEELAQHLRRKHELAGYEVQILRLTEQNETGVIVQMREKYDAEWKKTASQLTGLDTAATVAMRTERGGLTVEIGGGKWIDKAAVAGFATFVTLGALLIPAGIGAWKQRQLLIELGTEAESFIRQNAKSSLRCPACGAENRPAAKFCNECGKALSLPG